MTTTPTVLITGAASGIGRATAHLMAVSGWRCVLVDVDADGLNRVQAELPPSAGEAHRVLALDLTDATQFDGLAERLPPLDALINNAGRSDASGVALDQQPPAQLDRLLDLNLHAPARMAAACLPCLVAGGRIVNVASGAGLHAIPWRGAYSPSKAGVIALTQALSAAQPDRIVNALCPGYVRTELVDGLIASGRLDADEAVAMVPLGRMAAPAEMAHTLHFLASPDAACLRGVALSVDGGTSVYGGSRRLPSATLAPLPLDLPLNLTVEQGSASPWSAISAALSALRPAVSTDERADDNGRAAHVDGDSYPAVLDTSPLSTAEGGTLYAVHDAAVRFAARHPRQASLTLLMPAREVSDWSKAGDAAAARMLVSTLACEWGSRQLRINAVQVADTTTVGTAAPLLRFIAGAGAQYLTGQTLTVA
jgi:NAD(P)-dependent dehydrogenase (short-subunit alcohol dehydrogenase family)